VRPQLHSLPSHAKWVFDPGKRRVCVTSANQTSSDTKADHDWVLVPAPSQIWAATSVRHTSKTGAVRAANLHKKEWIVPV